MMQGTTLQNTMHYYLFYNNQTKMYATLPIGIFAYSSLSQNTTMPLKGSPGGWLAPLGSLQDIATLELQPKTYVFIKYFPQNEGHPVIPWTIKTSRLWDSTGMTDPKFIQPLHIKTSIKKQMRLMQQNVDSLISSYH